MAIQSMGSTAGPQAPGSFHQLCHCSKELRSRTWAPSARAEAAQPPPRQLLALAGTFCWRILSFLMDRAHFLTHQDSHRMPKDSANKGFFRVPCAKKGQPPCFGGWLFCSTESNKVKPGLAATGGNRVGMEAKARRSGYRKSLQAQASASCMAQPGAFTAGACSCFSLLHSGKIKSPGTGIHGMACSCQGAGSCCERLPGRQDSSQAGNRLDSLAAACAAQSV